MLHYNKYISFYWCTLCKL